MGASASLTQLAWNGELAQAMQPSADASPWAGLEGIEQNLAGAELWRYELAGQHALLAVRPVQLQRGSVLDVVGLVSLGDRLQAGPILTLLDQLAARHYGADLLSMQTKRPHLVLACERHGWKQAATVVIRNPNTKH